MGKKAEKTPQKKPRAARTIEGRERQLVNLAVDLAEKQLREGTASSQVITHYLKLGSTREKLEMERLRHENELTKAKTKSIESGINMEDLVSDAIRAIKEYRGASYDEYED